MDTFGAFTDSFGPQILKIVEIVWINVVLSGDNAVVIALACRDLPPERQRMGMVLGAGVAILLRVVFTAVVATLLTTPFLKIAGGLLLLWVAVKLVSGEEEASSVAGSNRLWSAVRTVAVADAVMSLDNVLAIAAVARDSTLLLILGLAVSIPLIVAGASLIIRLLERFPVLVWAGAALLGWIAGGMIVSDPAFVDRLGPDLAHRADIPAALAAAALVLVVGFVRTRRAAGSRA